MDFRRVAKPRPGDRVAVVSPSMGLPAVLPLPYELGLARLRGEFGLEVVEYPTTRRMGATPRERAADLHAAFADPDVKAVISSIGGDDQITVTPLLDAELLRANPKPFFGYSDCTNLLVFLWNLGIVGYHGGSVMCEFGRPGALHPVTERSLRAALLGSGPYDLVPAAEFTDLGRRWEDPRSLRVRAGAGAGRRLDLAPPGQRGGGPELGRQPGDPVLAAHGRPRHPRARGV